MADRYLLESGAPDGYLLEDGSGVLLLEVPPTPANVIWASARAAVAILPTILGLNQPIDIDPCPKVDHNRVIAPFRLPMQGGMAVSVTSSITLVEDQSGFPRQPDRTQTLFDVLGTPQVAAAQPQRLWVWRIPAKQEAEDEFRRTDTSTLHRLRTTYQTVGQPATMRPRAARAPELVDEARPPSPPSLHAYRSPPAAGVTQPSFLLFPAARAQLEPDFDIRRTDHWAALTLLRVQPTYGMTATFGPAQVVLVEPEWPVRAASPSLHAFRSTAAATQTTPFWQLVQPNNRAALGLDSWDDRRPADASLHLFRQAFQTVGQPWLTWPKPIRAQEWSEETPRTDQTTLHRFRTGYQTVGQPWLLWPKPTRAADAPEEFRSPAGQSLLTIRSTAPTAPQVSQPWWLWQRAKWVDTTEEVPRAAAPTLLPFQLTVALTWAFPEIVSPDITAEEYTVQPSPPGLLTMFRRTAPTPTPGQPWFMWQAQKPASLIDDDLPRPAGFGLHAFRSPPAAATQAGQPWFLWRAPGRGWLDEDTPRSAAPTLHLYRVGYQTVGQPLWTLQPARAAQVLDDELPRNPGVSLHAFRSPPAAASSQPIWLWKIARPLAAEDEPQRGAAVSLHAFRAPPAVALPGQPWFMWKPAREAMGPELDSQRAQPVTVHPFRWTPIVVLGTSMSPYQLSWRSAPHETFEVLDVYPAKHFELLAPFRTAPVTPQAAPCCYRRWFGPTFA